MLEEFHITQECVKIYCDNQNAIYLTNHEVYHEMTNYIDICFHFVAEKVVLEDNPTNMFNKLLHGSKI